MSNDILLATSVVHDLTFHALSAMTVGGQPASPTMHVEGRLRAIARRTAPIHSLLNNVQHFSLEPLAARMLSS